MVLWRISPDSCDVYNGPLRMIADTAGPVGSNGQARLALNRLRALNSAVAQPDQVPLRD